MYRKSLRRKKYHSCQLTSHPVPSCLPPFLSNDHWWSYPTKSASIKQPKFVSDHNIIGDPPGGFPRPKPPKPSPPPKTHQKFSKQTLNENSRPGLWLAGTHLRGGVQAPIHLTTLETPCWFGTLLLHSAIFGLFLGRAHGPCKAVTLACISERGSTANFDKRPEMPESCRNLQSGKKKVKNGWLFN